MGWSPLEAHARTTEKEAKCMQDTSRTAVMYMPYAPNPAREWMEQIILLAMDCPAVKPSPITLRLARISDLVNNADES